MPDWVWIIIVTVLVFALVYAWARSPAPAPAQAPARGPAPPDGPAASGAILGGAASDRPAAKGPSSRPAPAPAVPRLNTDDEEEAEVDPTKVGMAPGAKRTNLQPPTKNIVHDENAAVDEPTHQGALIVVSGMAQTDKGLRRKRNEDSILAMPAEGVYVVADGMGGYRGGEIASALAVTAIATAFKTNEFGGVPHEGLPRAASEVARAIQRANEAILQRAEEEPQFAGMGTTICAARFSPNKQRLYVGHVGDSRVYRLRDGALAALTSDHTMKDLGVTGAAAAHLSRAVGIWPTVPIDVILCKPQPNDLYLLCSDGLTKMLDDARIKELLRPDVAPKDVVDSLVAAANERGGVDNISVIVLRVDDPATAGRRV
jgi:protein phosphatase